MRRLSRTDVSSPASQDGNAHPLGTKAFFLWDSSVCVHALSDGSNAERVGVGGEEQEYFTSNIA